MGATEWVTQSAEKSATMPVREDLDGAYKAYNLNMKASWRGFSPSRAQCKNFRSKEDGQPFHSQLEAHHLSVWTSLMQVPVFTEVNKNPRARVHSTEWYASPPHDVVVCTRCWDDKLDARGMQDLRAKELLLLRTDAEVN